jgi:hypothetical protein
VSTLHSTSPRPWYEDGELSQLARARHPRRHESPMRWNEWVNVRDHVRLDAAAGAQYPADVLAMVARVETIQLPLPLEERRAA